MQKNAYCLLLPGAGRQLINKILLVMKLTIILLTAFLLQAHSNGMSQTVTISGDNMELEKVLSVVKRQTGYRFFYDTAVVHSAKKVSIHVKNQPLEQFLRSVFSTQPLDYTINNKTILIAQRERVTPSVTTTGAVGLLTPPVIALLTGTITGAQNEPLPGVSVRIKFSQKGTATNAKGNFILANVPDDAVLVVSSVGYQSQEIPVAGFPEGATKTVNGVAGVWKSAVLLDLRLSLQLTTEKMEEIAVTVNTGYQRIKPEQSTGSVAKLTAREYESRVNTDFLSGLVNKLPGLMINNDVQFTSVVDGVTSSNNLFNIRGISTISGNQNPLVVLDGYPTELSIDMINPNEIESVTILKDAAAATVYGVRASNGVIVVERKQAVIGKPRFNFRSSVSLTPKEDYTRYRWDDNASAINVDYQRERNKNISDGAWLNMNTFPGLSSMPVYYVLAQQKASIITPYQAEERLAEMGNYNNEADYARLFLRPAVNQTYNLNVSGGSKGALYYITTNYSRNRLQEINNKGGVFQLSGRTTLDLTNRLSLELSTDFTDRKGTSAPVPDINSIQPYERFEDENGTPLPSYINSGINPYYNDILMGKGLLDNLHYPLTEVEEVTDKSRVSTNRITANFRYRLGAGFNVQFGGVYENQKSEIKHYASERSAVARQYINSYTTINPSGVLDYNVPIGGFLQQRNSSAGGYTLRGQLNYDKRLGKDHSLNGIIGGEVRESITQSNSAAYFGYDDESLLQRPINYITLTNAFSNQLLYGVGIDYLSFFNQRYVNNRYLSGYSNIVYSFRNKYSLSGSIRVDQSNLFGTNPKYKYKPLWSVGAAWSIHKEEFMKDVTWLTELKVRVADGINGNVAKNSLPQVIAQSILNGLMQPVSPALTRSSFANSSLRWEQTRNMNLGIDFSIHKRISGSIDFYKKKSTDLLSSTTIDPTMGGGPTYINTASIANNGIEFRLQADWIAQPRFNWNTGLVLARNVGKTLKVYQNRANYPAAINSVGYLEGYPIGAMFSYRWAGVDNTGMPLVADEDGKIHKPSDPDYSSVMVGTTGSVVRFMGASVPVYNGGLSNRVDIGNFYLYCMINYYGGFKVQVPAPNPSATRPLEGSGNYWKQPGDELTSDVISLAGFASTFGNEAYNYADIRTVNGDYLTLGDITVSYDFSKYQAVRKAGFSSLELKLQASNIYTVGLNKYNYSMATRSFAKTYITPTYTIAIFTNF